MYKEKFLPDANILEYNFVRQYMSSSQYYALNFVKSLIIKNHFL